MPLAFLWTDQLLYLAMQRFREDVDGCFLWLHLALRNRDLNLAEANPQEDKILPEGFVESISAVVG